MHGECVIPRVLHSKTIGESRCDFCKMDSPIISSGNSGNDGAGLLCLIKMVFVFLILIMLIAPMSACGIKGNLVRPSDIKKEDQKN